ncbi:MAG: hypothetical protein OEN20_06805, partial [Gammaproteobacteria bacterium]|nr:hypothetical protein [Gammaproteobacteria bacterium]
YQTGITTARSTLIAVADALALQGFAAVAIDLPLHGLLPGDPVREASENGLTTAGIPLPTERTFDVDYVTQDPNGSITAPAPDMVTDSSGRHFINLSSLMTWRDNLRQAVSDLLVVHSQLGNMDYDGGTQPDFDTDDVHFLGWSLGAMVGSVFLALEPAVGAAVLAMPGGGVAKLLDGSPAFGPEIEAGLLAAAGIAKGTADYESFLGAAQTLVDSVDPLNYANQGMGTPGGNGGTTLAGTRGIMMFEVIGDGGANPPDQTIPNNVGTFPTFADAPPGTVPSPTAGTDPLHREMNLVPVTATALTGGGGVSNQPLPLLRFTAGYHGSIVDPAMDPLASLDVFDVMQTGMGDFLDNDGASFDVSTTNFAAVVANN